MSSKNKLFGILFILLFSLLVFVRYNMVVQKYSTRIPTSPFVGKITSNPVDKTYGQSFIFSTIHNEKVLVKNTTDTSFVYNDMLRIDATCSKPKNFETDLGNTFDYITYLKKDHIYSICDAHKIDFLDHKKSIIQTLFRFSDMIGGQIRTVFASPHNAFIGGVLVGDKTTISNSIRNDFIKTGTIHILALSGYNIAIVSLFFQYIFSQLFRKKIALGFSAVAIITFVAMTGFMASAIRAGLMALIVILAQYTYQKYSPIRALLFVSAVMVLYDPFYLLYDSSFHLSFLATYGVIVLSPVIHMYLHKIPGNFFRTTVSTTLGAYIMTLPYLLYFFNGLSFVGIFANIVILPFIPLLMLVSTIALGMSFISVSFAFVLTSVTEYISHFILASIHLFARIPFGYITTSIPLWICLGLYGLIFYLFFKFKKD